MRARACVGVREEFGYSNFYIFCEKKRSFRSVGFRLPRANQPPLNCTVYRQSSGSGPIRSALVLSYGSDSALFYINLNFSPQ